MTASMSFVYFKGCRTMLYFALHDERVNSKDELTRSVDCGAWCRVTCAGVV